MTTPLLGTPADKEIDMAEEKATVLRHPGIDDAAQADIELHAPLSDPPMHHRVDQDQKVTPPVGGIEGSLFPFEDDPMYDALKSEPTLQFRKDYIVAPGPDGYGTTDCSSDLCFDALKMGYRPCGDAKIEGEQNHPDGVHKVITWVVPVKAVAGKSPEDLDPKNRGHSSVQERDRLDREARDKQKVNTEPTPVQSKPEAKTGDEPKQSPAEKLSTKLGMKPAPKKD